MTSARPTSPVGSGTPADPRAAAKLTVVATTTQVQDFVRNVAGDRAIVLGILAPNTDPHDYQPTADDARKFARADLVFQNGVGLEVWADDLAKNLRPGVRSIKLGELAGLAVDKGSAGDPLGDPHVWQDPTLVEQMVTSVRDTLAAADPNGRPSYQTNAAQYLDQLVTLDRQIQEQIGTLPVDQRKLVTNHDAFGYYARRYGLTVVGSVIPSLSSDAEPSAAEIQALVQNIRAQKVKAIYTETNLNPRLEQQVAQQAGVKIYSDLYGDALGAPGSEGATYLEAMRFNTREIVDGLR